MPKLLIFISFFLSLSTPACAATLWELDASLKQQSKSANIENKQIAQDEINIRLNSKVITHLAIGSIVNIPISKTRLYPVVIERIKKHTNNDTSYFSTSGKVHLVMTIGKSFFYARVATPEGSFVLKGIEQKGVISKEAFFGKTFNPLIPDYIPPKYSELLETSKDKSNKRLLAHQINPFSLNKADNKTESEDVAIIDMLFVYSAQVAAQYDGDPSTRINHLIATTNQAFIDSQVYIELDLAGMLEVDYLQENHTNDDSLQHITSGVHESLLEVNNKRFEVGADIVSFLIETGCSGVAYGNEQISGKAHSMFHVADADCERTFAHELGHNLGLAHDRIQGPGGGYTFEFALGHGVDNAMATIMTYPDLFNASTAGVMQFSNTLNNCYGHPCGVGREDFANSSDAAFALNAVRFEAQALLHQQPDLTLASTALEGIADADLKSCISNVINAGNYRYAGALLKIECPESFDDDITSLAGIEGFFNLELLSLPFNQISDISPLAGLSKLYELNLSQNNISDLTPLSNLTSLSWLTLDDNPIEDLSALSSLNQLNVLELRGTRINELSPLFSLTTRWAAIYASFLNTSLYCWQVEYFKRFESGEAVFDVDENCDPSQDEQDFDNDSFSNILELSTSTNPIQPNNAPSQFQFSKPVYRTRENAGELQITIERIGEIQDSASLRITSKAIDASAGEDYLDLESPHTIQFSATETSKEIYIDIYDNMEFNQLKSFELILSPVNQEVLAAYSKTVVIIEDNENTLQWASVSYDAKEADGKAILTVERSHSTQAEVSVEYRVYPITALYNNLSALGRIIIPQGETSASVEIRLLNDDLINKGETFTVTLTNPTSANLGVQFNTTVAVEDDDNTPVDPTTPATPEPQAESGGGAIDLFLFLLILLFFNRQQLTKYLLLPDAKKAYKNSHRFERKDSTRQLTLECAGFE